MPPGEVARQKKVEEEESAKKKLAEERERAAKEEEEEERAAKEEEDKRKAAAAMDAQAEVAKRTTNSRNPLSRIPLIPFTHLTHASLVMHPMTGQKRRGSNKLSRCNGCSQRNRRH